MPNELEQLQLSVRLIDDATPGLAKLQQQVETIQRTISGGALDRLNRESRALAENLKDVGNESERFAKQLTPMGRGLAVASTSFAVMGVALPNIAKQLSDFANEGLKLAATSKMLGLLPGYIESMQKQLVQGGMTPEQAEKNFAAFALRLQELGKANNEARAQFIRQGGGTQEMKLLADEMIALGNQGKVKEAWNLWMERLRTTMRTQLAEGIPQAEVSRNATAMLAGLGIGEEGLNLVDQMLHDPSSEEMAAAQAKVDLSAEYHKEYTKLVQTIEKFEEQFKAAMLGPLTDLNKWLGENAGEWGDKLGDFIAATGRELAGLVKLVQNLAQGLKDIGNWLNTKMGEPGNWAPPSEFGPMEMPQIGSSHTAGHSEGGAAMFGRSSVFLDKRIQKDTENTEQLDKLNRLLTEMLAKTGKDIPIDTSQMRYNQPGAPTTSQAGGWSSALADERAARFGKELKDPRVRDRIMAYTHAETGDNGPEAQQAFMESIFNRASARNQTLAKTLSGGYFPPATHNKAARGVGEETRNSYAPILEDVVGGSNLSVLATGNASGGVGFGGGPTTFSSSGPPGSYAAKYPERVGWEGDPRDARWRAKMMASVDDNPGLDRAIMDGSSQMASGGDNDINASGKLNVEVRAPDNTTVEAEGKGLFNKTDINRYINMQKPTSTLPTPAGLPIYDSLGIRG